MLKGSLPEQIDHIDGNRSNNRIENLRPANSSQNACNRKKSSINTSGIKGVHWHKQSKKWRARIKLLTKDVSLGLFQTIDDAKNAIENERNKLHSCFSNNG